MSDPSPPAPAQPDSQVVHAPSPPATPPDQQEVHLVKPTTPSAKVVLTTVHNWVELVYQAFGQTMPTAATEIAILGVRSASLSGKGSMDTLEAEAADGETDKETTTRGTRDANFAHDPGWNDLLFIASTDSTPAKTQLVDVFECTIDAGIVQSSLGIPITLEGKLYGAHPGPHNPPKYPGNDICLHLYYGSTDKMAVARECTKTTRTFSKVASAENPITGWRFAGIEPDPGIHMHFGLEQGKVGSWSSGCTVLHHHYWKKVNGKNVPDPAATRYIRYRQLYLGAANKEKIPYLVVSSQYVRSYAEWVRYLEQTPGEEAKPESVIMKDKLRADPGDASRYLASFVTNDFATAVEALEAQPTTTKVHAANLKSSMDISSRSRCRSDRRSTWCKSSSSR